MTIPFNVSETVHWKKSAGVLNPRQGESIGPLTVHEATVNPHDINLALLQAGTLAELNAAITDATLDTNTAERPSKLLFNQALNGIIDNVNKVYATNTNFKSNTTAVFINGLQQRPGIDYNEIGATGITFIFTAEPPPQLGDELTVNYEEP